MVGPAIVAHRGGVRGSPGIAENTLAAFAGAIELGADMIEFDVRRTRDGELIVRHDEAVAGVPVRSLRRDEIAARTGAAPPLLADVVDLAAGRVQLDVELKEDGDVAAVHRLVAARFAPDEVVFTSFLDTVVAQVRDLDPGARTGLLVGAGPGPAVRRARACRATYLAPHVLAAKLGVLARAHAAGLPCLVWTVNDLPTMRTLLRDPRVAALITDRPAAARHLRDG